MKSTSTQLSSLIEGCKHHDRNCQSGLYKAIAPQMFAICLKYCRNRHDAEIVFEQGFVKLFNSIDQYKGKGSFSEWSKLFFLNTAFNYYENNKFSLTGVRHKLYYIFSANSWKLKATFNVGN